MTLETMEHVVSELSKRGIAATVEYPGFIQATVGTVTMNAGDQNDTFAIDIEEDGAVFETIESDLPSETDNVPLVTDFFAWVHKMECEMAEGAPRYVRVGR